MATRTAKSTSLIAGGDVAISRSKGHGALGALAPIFKKAGVAFFNLELPLSLRGKAQPDKILLRGTPEMADALTEAGLDTVSLANNHMFDYGDDAFADTLALLKEIGLPHTGAGMNLAAARRPSILERGGLKIGILCFSSILPRGYAATKSRPGLNAIRAITAYEAWRDVNEYPGTAPRIVTWTNTEDMARMKRDISALKKRVDVVMVNHHWGTSMLHGHQDYQTELGRASVDAGADLVLGGHAHVLQGIEMYKGVPIVYSMGNLIFDFKIPFFTAASKQTFLFRCTLKKGGVENPGFVPCWSGDFEKPRILSPRSGRGKDIVKLMQSLSEPLGAKIEVRGERVLIRQGKTAPAASSTAAFFGR